MRGHCTLAALIYASDVALYIKGYNMQQALAPIVMALLFLMLLVASFFPQAEVSETADDV